MSQKVLVLGCNFGGLTAALAVKHELDGEVDVEVISPSDRVVFNPSLIWLPFGKRKPKDITFPVEPTLSKRGIGFLHAEATELDPEHKRVRTGRAAGTTTTTWSSRPGTATGRTWCRACPTTR